VSHKVHISKTLQTRFPYAWQMTTATKHWSFHNHFHFRLTESYSISRELQLMWRIVLNSHRPTRCSNAVASRRARRCELGITRTLLLSWLYRVALYWRHDSITSIIYYTLSFLEFYTNRPVGYGNMSRQSSAWSFNATSLWQNSH